MRTTNTSPLSARLRPLFLVAIGVAASLATSVTSLAAAPQLSLILPRGVQRGGERELVFQGARLKDAEELLFHGSGATPPAAFTVKSITPVDDNSFKAVIDVPADCRLGEHLVQVRCRSGLSDFRSFVVGVLPRADEKEPNGSLEEAQPIEAGVTVQGVVTSEDIDLFAVKATKGQRISVDVEALRLGSYLFDPAIAILDARRFELAAVDDAPIARQDGVLSILAPEDGTYYVQIRETSYGGDGNCRYLLHVGGFPRPTAVYPAGGKAGETVAVTFLGDAAGPIRQDVAVPAVGDTLSLFPADAGGICPTPLPLRISTFGNTLEQEPNNDVAAANTAAPDTAFNGVIETPGDVDCFRFKGAKGQTVALECYARRIRSGLDPLMTLSHADGRAIASNDDSRGPDSFIQQQLPDDGDYVVRVTDHLGRGQSDFVYRVEIDSVRPSLAISIPRIDRYSQTRQSVAVPRGNRFAVLVNAARANFGGELALEAGSLPAGITMHARTMPAGATQMPVVFEATADAPIAGRLVSLEARPTAEEPKVRGRFGNVADFVLGQPNNSVYYASAIDSLAMAVVEPAPFHLEIVQPKAPLVRNGSMGLKVVVKRSEGFTGAVTVEFPYRPGGIGAPPNIQIAADATEGVYPIDADGNAALGTWPIYCIGQADAGGPVWAASQLATMDVVEPFVAATLARASCEQGQPAQIVCTLEQKTAFEGEAIARLNGLPPETAVPELRFTKDSTQLVFEVATTDKSPVGNHKTPFVETIVTVAGEPVRGRGGQTELQIAAPSKPAPAPAPAPATAAAAPAPAAAPAAAPAKPLSRLEKLRQQAKAGGAQ